MTDPAPWGTETLGAEPPGGGSRPVLLARWLAGFWRRSLQVRAVASTTALSTVVLLVAGLVIMGQIGDRQLDAKRVAAVEQTEAARSTVTRELLDAGDSTFLQGRLNSTRSAIASGVGQGESTSTAGSFDSILIAPATSSREELVSGNAADIPADLRGYIGSGSVSYQYHTVTWEGGGTQPALIVGTPTAADVPGLELYLVFPLTVEQRNLALTRTILLAGGGALLILLTGIALLVTRQVVLPVRAAAAVADRYASGELGERMVVSGEDDVARMAAAFNGMAENLQRQIGQLEEFGSLARRFTSDVSHELRTPLTTVRMAADLLDDSRDELPAHLGRSVELLTRELDRFEIMLGDLLEISRHDAGVAELEPDLIDIRAAVWTAAAGLAGLAEATGSELKLDLPEEPVLGEVEARRVERILRNLMANALDHGEGRPVIVRLRADETTVALAVRDRGVGLRPGEEELVFNRFWRSDPSRVRLSGGTGLGLAIALEDARLHHGELNAWGDRGEGACFRLTLPLRAGERMGPSPLTVEGEPR